MILHGIPKHDIAASEADTKKPSPDCLLCLGYGHYWDDGQKVRCFCPLGYRANKETSS